MMLDEWGELHGIPEHAMDDLKHRMGMIRTDPIVTNALARGEAAVSNSVRLEAADLGIRLMRNNVGACQDKTGRVIRYGLANESKAMNEVVKSHDLIGIRAVLITQAMVGRTIGQFVSRECKEENWWYTGTEREEAQGTFGNLINSLGGDAKFVWKRGSFDIDE